MFGKQRKAPADSQSKAGARGTVTLLGAEFVRNDPKACLDDLGNVIHRMRLYGKTGRWVTVNGDDLTALADVLQYLSAREAEYELLRSDSTAPHTPAVDRSVEEDAAARRTGVQGAVVSPNRPHPAPDWEKRS